MTDWKSIHTDADLTEVIDASQSLPVLIFKHSTRCGISSMAKRSLVSLNPTKLNIYLIDVISDRSISNRVTELFAIRHESPQAILLIGGEVVWYASHSKVRAEAIELQIDQSHIKEG